LISFRFASTNFGNNECSPALQRDRFYFIAEIQDQLHIAEPVQQTGMDDVHHVREIKRAVGAFGPAAIASEEFPRARVSQQSFHWRSEIHAQKSRTTR
jgi:hypothetical protein